MNNWFECKVSYEKQLENGMQKKVTEAYLVGALSFTEAEARVIENVQKYISGEFSVEGVRKMRLSETFFNNSGDRYYRAKLSFIFLDEKSGMEKKKASHVLIEASSIKEALTLLEEGMKGTMADYEIASIVETQIFDVFKYEN